MEIGPGTPWIINDQQNGEKKMSENHRRIYRRLSNQLRRKTDRAK
jgi:hypothetical protein